MAAVSQNRANTNFRLAVNWGDAKYRVLKSYREWLRAVSLPENQPIPLPCAIYVATWHWSRSNTRPVYQLPVFKET
jgi:hypothetical protein